MARGGAAKGGGTCFFAARFWRCQERSASSGTPACSFPETDDHCDRNVGAPQRGAARGCHT
eukprot:3157997-Pyramimonas_sp.AAC.1